MTTTKRTIAILAAMLALGAGCDDGNGGTDGGGTDSGTPTTDGAAPFTATCEIYCDTIMSNCTDANAQYADRDECIPVCNAAGWAAGDQVTATGPLTGPTLGCRTYHAGAPAAGDPALHCPHAGPTGADTCGTFCEAYCALALGGCTGGEQLYADGEECATACAAFDDSGTIGDTSGDTVQCRLYHLGVAITTGMTTLHCPHAAPDGGGVCVGGWDFRSDDPTDYTRVDRMGMPAVSTALVSDTGGTETTKNDYNDGDPEADVAMTFVPELGANLQGLHTVLDVDDLAGAGLISCAAPVTFDPTACLAQEVAPGVPVGALVIPDTLTVNTSAAAGFPNGRLLSDPVIDVTLAVILLDLDAGTQSPTTIAELPLNPPANDVDFLDAFPYLAPPHAP